MTVAEVESKSFNEFVAEQVEVDPSLSLEQCFDRWREERERQELLRDIQLSIADIEAGRVWTIDEADAEIRRRLGWPAQS